MPGLPPLRKHAEPPPKPAPRFIGPLAELIEAFYSTDRHRAKAIWGAEPSPEFDQAAT